VRRNGFMKREGGVLNGRQVYEASRKFLAQTAAQGIQWRHKNWRRADQSAPRQFLWSG